jgi:hypothetical protein
MILSRTRTPAMAGRKLDVTVGKNCCQRERLDRETVPYHQP